MIRSNVLAPLLAFAAILAAAAAEPHTPRRGSPERKALMDALRQPVQVDLKRPTIFKIGQLRVLGDWAFMTGVPLQKDGSAMNYRGTRYEQDEREGFFDDNISALLKRGADGRWFVVIYNIGATDVSWVPWPDWFDAPRVLFGIE